jgi:uncharacterized membrane protein (DUF2068 family)
MGQMSGDNPPRRHTAAPGTERPRRFRPKLRYELIGCGLHGHEILGTEAAELRPEDQIFARESGGLRWYRCMRCDSWLALTPPSQPARKHPPAREKISLPLRGKPLRDRYVLRLIALDCLVHFLILSALAAAVLLFAGDRASLDAEFTRILNDLQGGVGGPMTNSKHGIVHDLQLLFSVSIRNLYLLGAAIAAYAVLKSIEAVGLWFARRWAEYLTFVSTLVFIPVEIHELIKSITALKVLAFVINVAIAVYLLYAKRLFGLRGGGKAEHAEREADTGWPAIERSTPHGSTPERSTPHGSTPEIPHGSIPGRSAPRGTPETRLPACGGPVACGPEPAEVGA